MGRLTKLEWELPWDTKSRTVDDYEMDVCFDLVLGNISL